MRSKKLFIYLCAGVAICLFLPAGFTSMSVILFFIYCLVNYTADFKSSLYKQWILLFPIFLFLLNVLWLFFSDDAEQGFSLVLRKIHLILLPIGFILVNKKFSNSDLHIVLGVL